MYKSNWFYLKGITTQKSNKNLPVSKAYKKSTHKTHEYWQVCRRWASINTLAQVWKREKKTKKKKRS